MAANLTKGRVPRRGIDRRTVDVHLDTKFAHLKPEMLHPTLLTSLFEVIRPLGLPLLLIVIASGGLLIANAKTSSLQDAYVETLSRLTGGEDIDGLDSLELATRLDSLEKFLLENVPPDPTRLAEQQSQITFIASLIAAHRPNIVDCGAVAKDIVEISAAERVDPFYVAAIISVESRFGTHALSPAGAQGLMQLMPATARHVAKLKADHKLSRALTDSRINILLGISYLKQLEARYRGNRKNVLAAYNWGPTKVDSAVKTGRTFPRSVRDYASTIEKRTKEWSNHYEKARESAATVQGAV